MNDPNPFRPKENRAAKWTIPAITIAAFLISFIAAMVADLNALAALGIAIVTGIITGFITSKS